MSHKVCIVGAGAIGGWVGTRLAGIGCEVSVLARGATLAALRANGLQLVTGVRENQPRTQTQAVRAHADAAALGPQDLIVIAVKAPAMAAIARQVATLLAPHTVVLTAMNGVPWWFLHGFGGDLQGCRLDSVDPGGAIAAAIPAEQVIGGVVHASCSVRSPGMVVHGFGNQIILGEPSGQPSERVRALSALLVRAGFEAPVSEQIQREIWFKLWGNMTMNPVSAITGASSTQILEDDLVRGLCSRIMEEARAIGSRLGIRITQSTEDRHDIARKLGAFKTSMLQDVEAGKPVELDALVGAVQELGRLTGVATPLTDVLLGLARLHARVRGLY